MFHVNHPEPGAEIHHSDPFATPEDARSPVRRLRGQLASPVTLWTAGGSLADVAGGRVVAMAGLTVSSTMIADGDPARLVGLLDDESQLWAVAAQTGRFAMTPLGPTHRRLADRFAGLMPAPGGPFKGLDWRQTGYGPIPAGASSWIGCKLDGSRPYGWGLLVEATIEEVVVGDGAAPLIHYRGRYRDLAD